MKGVFVKLTLAWIVTLCTFALPGFAQERRVALVIGNSDYKHVSELPNPVNDAADIGLALERLGFEVTVEGDLDYTAMRLSLRDFGEKAAAADIALIYFAGHGATEKDVLSPDGDGLEKYLLPFDADPKDLYASALPMREIFHIFYRIQSERLIFIADSCYSGASGGRTIQMPGVRASISDAFLDRLSAGKGTIILTASGANEVSMESDEFKHGIFTYFLLEGLKGKADIDDDGLITVDELYRYVSDNVANASGQEQHPVKKGSVEGRFVLGVIN